MWWFLRYTEGKSLRAMYASVHILGGLRGQAKICDKCQSTQGATERKMLEAVGVKPKVSGEHRKLKMPGMWQEGETSQERGRVECPSSEALDTELPKSFQVDTSPPPAPLRLWSYRIQCLPWKASVLPKVYSFLCTSSFLLEWKCLHCAIVCRKCPTFFLIDTGK